MKALTVGLLVGWWFAVVMDWTTVGLILVCALFVAALVTVLR